LLSLGAKTPARAGRFIDKVNAKCFDRCAERVSIAESALGAGGCPQRNHLLHGTTYI
jgi:hypothetical protein